MKLMEFLQLVNVVERKVYPRGRRFYVPLDDIIDVLQRNDLEVRNRPTPWSISADISSLTDLGVDEARDALMPILRKWANREARERHNISPPKPLCAADPDCDNCETDVDCGGKEELRPSEQSTKVNEK